MAARIQTTNPVRGKFVRLPSGPAPVHRCLRHRHKLYAHNEASSSRDEDYNEDGAALAAEFEKFRRADPQGASKHAKHLDLLWRLQTDVSGLGFTEFDFLDECTISPLSFYLLPYAFIVHSFAAAQASGDVRRLPRLRGEGMRILSWNWPNDGR
jgi:hypothetical protein